MLTRRYGPAGRGSVASCPSRLALSAMDYRTRSAYPAPRPGHQSRLPVGPVLEASDLGLPVAAAIQSRACAGCSRRRS